MEEVSAAPARDQNASRASVSQEEGARAHDNPAFADDYAEHERTYRLFVKGVALFAAHVLAILILLALFVL